MVARMSRVIACFSLIAAIVAGSCGGSGTASRATTPPSPSPSPPPAAGVTETPDSRAVAFVSVNAVYTSGGHDVWEDVHDYDAAITECFDRFFPIAGRTAEVFYFHVFVPNPDHDNSSGGFGFGSGLGRGGISYPDPSQYPDFTACVKQAIGPRRAPPDVALVELTIHVHTHASRGLMGHGR